KWVAVFFEFQGNKVADDDLGKFTVEIDQDHWTFHTATEVLKGTHKLNPSKKPKEFTGETTEGPGVGEKILGIYEIEGDTWKECWGDPGKDRPKEFKADAASGHNLIIWKRQEAQDQKPTKVGLAMIGEPVLYYEEVAGKGSPVLFIHGGQLD